MVRLLLLSRAFFGYLIVALLVNASLASMADDISIDWRELRELREERVTAGVCLTHVEPDYDLCNKSATLSLPPIPGMPPLKPQPIQQDHCGCDETCHLHDNCCIDVPQKNPRLEPREWSCIRLPPYELTLSTIFAIGSCPKTWATEETRELCENKAVSLKVPHLQGIPVYSEKSELMYSNLFCAICNNDTDQLMRWDIKFRCKVNGKEKKTDLRYLAPSHYNVTLNEWVLEQDGEKVICSSSIDQFLNWSPSKSVFKASRCYEDVLVCPQTWPQDEVRMKCDSYTSYVFTKDVKEAEGEEDEEEEEDESESFLPPFDPDEGETKTKTFKNFHCSICNSVHKSLLRCVPPASSRDFVDPSLLPPASLSLLFDFDFGAEKGPLVGGQSASCSLAEGLLYDPIGKKCLQLYCGKHYEYDPDSGRCFRSGLQTGNETSLDSDCLKLLLERKDFTLNDNETVFVPKLDLLLNPVDYEVFDKKGDKIESILICVDNKAFSIPFNFSVNERLLTAITLFVSILCLMLHLASYALLPKLRNVPGKTLMSLSSALLMAYLSFLIGSYNRPERGENILTNKRGSLLCVFMGITIHYCYLVSFCWMNVMAFDIYKTFRPSGGRPSSRSSSRRFLKYSIYSWLAPALLVLISCAFDIAGTSSLYQPLYGFRVCWLSQRRAVLVFFAIPIGILLSINVVLFAMTAYSLVKTRKETKMVTNRKESDKCRFLLYIKLATIMGITWTFGFLAALAGYMFLWYPFILFNGLQGAIIFVAFTCKRKVATLLKERLAQIMDKDSPSSAGPSFNPLIGKSTSSSASTSLLGQHSISSPSSTTTSTTPSNSVPNKGKDQRALL